MKGNYLSTNGWKRYYLPRVRKGMSIPIEEQTQRYYRLRTEKASREWCHIYAAIVLLARYNEIPSASNMPRVLPMPSQSPSDVVNFDMWDIPDGFIGEFLLANTTPSKKNANKNQLKLMYNEKVMFGTKVPSPEDVEA